VPALARKGWEGFSPKDRSEAEPCTARPRASRGCAISELPNGLVALTSTPVTASGATPASGGHGACANSLFPTDTIIAKNDTVKKHSPTRAAIYSAVVPSLGQIYNKQYWKAPIIYAGGAVAGYLIYYNYTVYNNIHQAFKHRKKGDVGSYEHFSVKTIGKPLNVDLTQFTDADVLQLQTTYRRDLDLSVLLATGIYAINIIDALVFAHLYDFDVSDDLALRVQPDFRYAQNGLVKPSMQVGLTYRF